MCVWPDSDETLLLLLDDIDGTVVLPTEVVVAVEVTGVLGVSAFGARSLSFGIFGNWAETAIAEPIDNVSAAAMIVVLVRMFFMIILLR